jgi:hypothetical protein
MRLEHCGDKLKPMRFETREEAQAVANDRINKRGPSYPQILEYPKL